jgi:hypothetical protein
MATVTVRYIVNDVDASIDFYCGTSGSTNRCTRRHRSPCSSAATSVLC